MQSQRRTTYQHGNLRAALIDGALALVAERGVRDFSLAEAARRAGVSGGAPYRHFRDRSELLAAVAARAYRQIAERLREARATCDGDAIEEIGAMGAAYVRFAADQRAAFEVLFDAGLSKSAYPELLAAGDEALEQTIGAAKRITGDDDGRAGKLAVSLWAASHGFAMLMLEGALEAKGIDEDATISLAASANRSIARATRARLSEILPGA